MSFKEKVQFESNIMVLAAIEIMYFFLPVAIYSILLILTGKPVDEIKSMPAWLFMSFAISFSIVRATLAFNNDYGNKIIREISFLIGISGIVFSAILLLIFDSNFEFCKVIGASGFMEQWNVKPF